MYNVTQDFKDAIYSNTRSITGVVVFDITPIGIESEIPTVGGSAAYALSNSAQLMDNVRTENNKLITWEYNRAKLDGQWTFPDDNSANWGEIGWVSGAISDANNTFTTTLPAALPAAMLAGSTPQVVSLTFNGVYTTSGVTITFSPLFNEYATDFSIKVYDSGNSVIHETVVTDNASIKYVLQTNLINFKKIELIISKWSQPYRHARVVEIDPGVVLTYEDDKLIRFSLTEEMDNISNNVAIPEFEFTINNLDGAFSILNPEGIYASLQQRQRIQPALGLDLGTRFEYVPLGTFYLSEWRSDVGSITATFRGRSKIDLLDLTTYEQTTAQVGYNLYTLAESILTTAGVSGYYIDTELQNISTNGLISLRTCREALQMVAIASCATIRIDRNDVLRIETTRQISYVNEITFEAVPSPSQIQQFKGVKNVSVDFYSDMTTVAGTSVQTSTYVNGEIINVIGNTLINDSLRALTVAGWIRDRRNERNTFTIDYRGNPALELNDLVRIQNVYNTSQNVYISKNELSYEGYLTGRIEGRTS